MLTIVSCSTEPQPEDSPLTGEWISTNDPWDPSLALDLLEDDAGEISGSYTIALGSWQVQGDVNGEYTHSEVQLDFRSGVLVLGDYTGKRVDGNSIDGNFEFGGRVVATRLKRRP